MPNHDHDPRPGSAKIPTTGDPISAEQLILENDQLTAMLHSGDYSALVPYVESLRAVSLRQSRTIKAVAVIAVFGVILGFVVGAYAARVDHNSNELNRTQAAIEVFCEQTNDFNAEARSKFLALFASPTPANQTTLQGIADAAWPQRNCTLPSTSVVPPDQTVTVP